jgi:hypothetical protein
MAVTRYRPARYGSALDAWPKLSHMPLLPLPLLRWLEGLIAHKREEC